MRSWTASGLALTLGLGLASCGSTTNENPAPSCPGDDCGLPEAGGGGASTGPGDGGSATGGDGFQDPAGAGGQGPAACATDCAASDRVCVDGACLERICAPGERACGDTDVEECTATGTGWAMAIDCGPFYHCETTGEPRCVARICEPGTDICVNNVLKACTDAGGLPDEGQDCGDDVCFDGACRLKQCEPGSLRCIDGDVHTCDAAGLQNALSVECPSDAPCGPGLNGGVACSTAECDLGETVCFDNTLGTCAADGHSLATTTQNCASTDEVCSLVGACAASVTELAGKSLEVEPIGGVVVGNVIDVRSSRRISKLEAHLLLDVPRDLRWMILEWQPGAYAVKVNAITTNNVGSAFFASPPLDYVVESGKRYILAVGTVVGEGYAYYEPRPERRRLSFGQIDSTAAGDSSRVDASGSSWIFGLRVTSALP